MPYISAFSSEGAALMTLGTTRSPSGEMEGAWRSRRTAARRRGVGMDEDEDDAASVKEERGCGVWAWLVVVVVLESVLRRLAIQGAVP